MSELFLKIVNMSISASWVVIAVLTLRFCLKKAPKWVNVLLWGIVAARMVFPFSIESVLSLIPSAETISPTVMMEQTPSVQTGVPALNHVINPVISSSFTPAPGASANPLQIWIPVLTGIWLFGIAALFLYSAVSYWRLHRKVCEAVILRGNIYQSEKVCSPFVLGIIKPKIYIPYHMDSREMDHVIAHEQTHIRRKDHWWKPLGFLLLTIHWFNPLMWLSYILLCRDIELACDEKVIREMGNEQRADYTQALVACSVNRRVQNWRAERKLKPWRDAAKAEQAAVKANADFYYRKAVAENPQLASNPVSRLWQKRKLQKQYAAAYRAAGKTAQAGKTAETTAKAAKKTAQESKRTALFLKRHWKGALIVGGIGLLLVMLLGSLQSCSSMFGGGVSNIMASSYLSEDADMLAAEEAYCAKEDELREYLDTYEATHDYDEYHFDLDEIEHDPYVLISILSALHEGVFTIDQVQGDLQTLFDKQYILTETVTTETRYRTETRTDSEGNTYTVRVPYTWTICTVTLENFDLSHVPVYMMGEEQLSLYATYMSTLGNRPDLFPSSGYVNKYIDNPPTAWEIPAEYLTDERFNTLITEAEKYLGYPYVWGGSSPSTSFDCSGFVSYVLTNSGLCNTGRLGAQGLYNISTPVSDPQPGDLVFFVGTYDTTGVSHVGIYVGDGMMLHCGDPIQYSNLNTSYWQSHFYAYGRPPYN